MRLILSGIALASTLLLGAQWGMGPGPGIPLSGSTSHTFTHTSNYAWTSSNSGATITLSPPSATVAGEFGTLCVQDYNNFSSTPPTMTAIIGGGVGIPQTLTMVSGSPAGSNPIYGGYAFLFYVPSLSAYASPTITITASNTISFSAAWWDEYSVTGSGAVNLDSQASYNGSYTLPLVPVVSGTNDLLSSCPISNNSLSGVGGAWVGTGAPTNIYATSYWSTYITNATSSTAVAYTGSNAALTASINASWY